MLIKRMEEKDAALAAMMAREVRKPSEGFHSQKDRDRHQKEKEYKNGIDKFVSIGVRKSISAFLPPTATTFCPSSSSSFSSSSLSSFPSSSTSSSSSSSSRQRSELESGITTFFGKRKLTGNDNCNRVDSNTNMYKENHPMKSHTNESYIDEKNYHKNKNKNIAGNDTDNTDDMDKNDFIDQDFEVKNEKNRTESELKSGWLCTKQKPKIEIKVKIPDKKEVKKSFAESQFSSNIIDDNKDRNSNSNSYRNVMTVRPSDHNKNKSEHKNKNNNNNAVWNCTACTYQNISSHLICKICLTEKFKKNSYFSQDKVITVNDDILCQIHVIHDDAVS